MGSLAFPIFDISIHSGDIHDQSLKLSEIVPNLGHFLPTQILGVQSLPKCCTQVVMPASWHVTWKSFVTLLPIAKKVIGMHTLNFMPIFEFLLLEIVGGTPVPRGVCIRKPWSFPSMCKNLKGQRPLEAEILSSKKVDLGGSKLKSPTLLLWTKVHQTCFA